MKELVILSGKGGTGKTSLVGSLCALAENKIMVDCDVDAADLHLIIAPRILEDNSFIGGEEALIDSDRCTGCGECLDYCYFDAIKPATDSNGQEDGRYRVDPLACEGCAVCSYYCPDDAIRMEKVESGRWYVSETRHGPMVHARLGIAQSNSGRLVSLLRRRAREMADKNGTGLIIVDGPPGIGCPVIAALTGAQYALLVTEPTRSAFHDLKRLLELTGHFRIPAGVVINKYDINPEVAAEIEEHVAGLDLKLLGKIDYDQEVTKAQVAGTTLIEYSDNNTSRQIKDIWHRLTTEIEAIPEGASNEDHKITGIDGV